jgi:hypothetical protein
MSCGKLVEVAFALDDLPEHGFKAGHTVLGFYITSDRIGMSRSIYNWAEQGGHTPDTNAAEKAAHCLKLLRTLQQPSVNGAAGWFNPYTAAQLPQSPNHIVTVRGVDGSEVIERKFPISEVPSEIREILAIMGYPDAGGGRLTFIKKTAPSPPSDARERSLLAHSRWPSILISVAAVAGLLWIYFRKVNRHAI